MKYDVLIIGAGPAGSWLLRELAREKISVVLLERATAIGEPNFSSAGSPSYTIQQFDLPKESVAAKWNVGRVTGNGITATWNYNSSVGVVFDFRKLKSLLLEQAKNFGAEIILSAHVTNVEFSDDSVRVSTIDGHIWEAKIVVDASGPAAVIARRVGLRNDHVLPSTGIEIMCIVSHTPEHQRETLEFFWGHDWAPHGYAWIFPMGGDFYKVGICVYRLAAHPELNLNDLLKQFIGRFSWLRDIRIIETHGGSAFMQGGISKHSYRNVLVIGDAADSINPFGGEGIRHALQSAKFAHYVIRDALKTSDVQRLVVYDAFWKAYIGNRWRLSAFASILIYQRFGRKMMRMLMRVLNKLTPSEAFAVVFEYHYVFLLKGIFRFRRPEK